MQVIPKEDWPWLVDVHKVDITGAVVITLQGSEDAPTKIEVFSRDHYQAIPLRAYAPDADGTLVLVSTPEGHALDTEDFFKLRDICAKLSNATHRLTWQEQQDLGKLMHHVLHKAIHV